MLEVYGLQTSQSCPFNSLPKVTLVLLLVSLEIWVFIIDFGEWCSSERSCWTVGLLQLEDVENFPPLSSIPKLISSKHHHHCWSLLTPHWTGSTFQCSLLNCRFFLERITFKSLMVGNKGNLFCYLGDVQIVSLLTAFVDPRTAQKVLLVIQTSIIVLYILNITNNDKPVHYR